MKLVVIIAIAGLLLLQQDFWFGGTIEPMVFGFIPAGLAYQAFVSLLAAATWALVARYAWPSEREEENVGLPGADEKPGDG